MPGLVAERCVACRADSPHVTGKEEAELHREVPEWTINAEDEIPRLERAFRLSNFRAALSFSDAVGALAEEQGHHPRLITEWGRVTVAWWTHAIRGLHRNDFVMAARTDQVYTHLGRR